MRIRRPRPRYRPHNDLIDQTEAEALASFAMLRQDVGHRFVWREWFNYSCHE